MTFMYSNWNMCTIIGIVAGRMLQDIAGWGLDFAMVAAFIGMVLPYVKDRPNWCAVSWRVPQPFCFTVCRINWA